VIVDKVNTFFLRFFKQALISDLFGLFADAAWSELLWLLLCGRGLLIHDGQNMNDVKKII
jgi:hypothetical protein